MKKNITEILNKLWSLDEFDPSNNVINDIMEAYNAFDFYINYELVPFTKMNKMRNEYIYSFVNDVYSLESQLGLIELRGDSTTIDTTLLFDLTVDREKKCIFLKNNYNDIINNNIFAINPNLNDDERIEDFRKFIQKKIISLELEDISSFKTIPYPIFKEKQKHLKTFIFDDTFSVIKPDLLTKVQPEESNTCFYEFSTPKGNFLGLNYTFMTSTYNQPSLESITKYIRLRKYYKIRCQKVYDTRKKNGEVTNNLNDMIKLEDDIIQYLEWVKLIISSLDNTLESDTKYPIEISSELIVRLSKRYPKIPCITDFYKNIFSDTFHIQKSKNFTAIIEKNPLLERLKIGTKSLQKNSKQFLKDPKNNDSSCKNFLKENDLNENLASLLNTDQIKAITEDNLGKSRMDIVLHMEGQYDLAIEAKIGFKDNKIIKEDVKKALFNQAVSYSECIDTYSSVVLYAFNSKLENCYSGLINLVSSENGWKLTLAKPNHKAHLKLIKNSGDNSRIIIDVIICCLHSISNTDKNKK